MSDRLNEDKYVELTSFLLDVLKDMTFSKRQRLQAATRLSAILERHEKKEIAIARATARIAAAQARAAKAPADEEGTIKAQNVGAVESIQAREIFDAVIKRTKKGAHATAA